MPILHVNMLAGRSNETKQVLAEQLTKVMVETLEVSPEKVRVLLHEVEPGQWFVGGRPIGVSQPPGTTSDKPETQ